MSVQIRLARYGRKKLPFYRLVATEKGSKRDGRFIETLGTFDPTENPAKSVIKSERVKAWIQVGAQCSDTAFQLIEKEIPGYLSGIMSDRLKKYISKQKKKGYKRVSFFVDEKLWEFLKKVSKSKKLSIPDYLKSEFDYK